MTKKLLSLLPIVVILFFAFFLRWWHITSVAPGISNDELGYSLTAKSFFLTGTDLAGTTHPLSVLLFKYPPTDPIQAELPYLLHLPFDGPLAYSLAEQRLPYVLMSLGIVLLLYVIAKELFDRRTGIIAGLLATINPYLVVTGRTTYEVVPAAFFYLLAFYLFLRLKGWKILFILPVLFAAFYAYIGTKVTFLPFTFLLSLFGILFLQKKDRKYYILLSAGAILFVVFYLLMLHLSSSGARLGNLLLPSNPVISSEVNMLRKNSLSSPLNSFLINKYTVYGGVLITNFFNTFATPLLFETGDGFYKVQSFGVLYYVDGIFSLLGIGFLFAKRKIVGLFLSLVVVAASLPQVIFASADPGGVNYAHASLVFPFLILFIALGVSWSIDMLKGRELRRFAGGVLVLLYAVSLLFFVQAYFYQYPLLGKDDFSARLVSRYVSLSSQKGKHIVVLSPSSTIVFKKYVFYANMLNKDTVQTVKKDFSQKKYQLGNVTFESCTHTFSFNKNTIVLNDVLCGNTFRTAFLKIPLVIDGGASYQIYQDNLCSSYNLKSYPSGLTLSDFHVETMPRETFCETFITR